MRYVIANDQRFLALDEGLWVAVKQPELALEFPSRFDAECVLRQAGDLGRMFKYRVQPQAA